MPLEIKKDIEKQGKTKEIIEYLILKYKKRIEIINKKKFTLFTLSKKLYILSKPYLFRDYLYLYLLRKNLYRILDRSIKEANFKKLIKNEILKAPKGTFSEFLNLFNDIIKELCKKSLMQNDT